MKSLSRAVFTALLVLLVKDGKDETVEAQNTLCEVTQESEEAFIWKTPEFGKAKYVTDFNCTYARARSGSNGPKPGIVTYSLNYFEIQNKTREKCRDKVRFFKPYSRNIKICGIHTGKKVQIPMGNASAEFVSNHRKGAPGFNISVSFSSENSGEINLNSAGTSSYNLMTPSYPMKVVDIAGEYWFTTDEPGKRLQIDIDIDSKKTRCCRKDYLVVNPKGDALYPRTTSRIFCGIKRTSIISKGQKLFLSFRSHHRVKFNLTISTI